jgi:hypothetical protein
MFNRKRKAQPDLEAALASLVKSGVACAETLCAACQMGVWDDVFRNAGTAVR